MHTICMVLTFLSACTAPQFYGAEYSRAESNKAFSKMVYCASQAAELPADSKNAIYTRCLVALGATN